MKKPVKILLAVGATLITLCLAILFLVPLVVDPNEYKGEITRLVHERTGRELAFEGDIELSFFPYVGFSVGPVALGNAPGFDAPEMLRINRAEVSLRLIPLFSGKVAVGRVVLDGLSVHLVRNEQGKANWADLAGGEDLSGEALSSGGSAESRTDGGVLDIDDISVQGVEVTNAQLVYADMWNQSEAALDNLSLTLGAIHGTERFPFALGFDLALDQPALEAHPRLSGDIRIDPAGGSYSLENLQLSVLGLEVAGELHAAVQDGTPSFSGELQIAETSLRDLLSELGMALPDMADPNALERFSAQLGFDGTDDSIELGRLDVNLDDTVVSARGAVSDFAAPKISIAIHADDIDADRYLPPAAGTEAAASSGGAEGLESGEAGQEPDLKALRTLALDAKVEVDRLKVKNVRASDLLVELKAEDGILAVAPLSAALYGGRFEGRAGLDASGDAATWEGEGSLRDLEIGPLLQDFQGKKMLSGVASLEYALSGKGLTSADVKQSVSGNVGFAVSEGAVIGVDVAKMIRDGWNQIMGADVDGEEAGDFDFSRLSASAALRNGHIVNNDLLFDSPLVEASGEGWADLPKNTVNYKAMVTVVGALDGLEGEILDTVKDVPFPLLVNGQLDQPSIGLDMAAMGQLLVTAGVSAGIDLLTEGLLGDDDSSNADDDEDADEDTEEVNLLEGLF